MKKTETEDEISRLREELSRVKKQNKSIVKKLETAKAKNTRLKKEVKKKGVRTIELTDEQQQLLSSLSSDIDIPSLLSD